MQARRDRFTVLSETAKRQETPCASALYGVVESYLNYLSKDIKASRGVDPQLVGSLCQALDRIKRVHVVAYATDGWHLAGALAGIKSYVECVRCKAGLASEGADELIASRLSTRIDKWLSETSVIETEETAAAIQRIYRAAETGSRDEEGNLLIRDLGDLADDFIREGLAWASARADLLARTVTNWSYNEGAVALYQEESIKEVEWMTTEDDATCEYCAEMDGTIIPTGDSFMSAGDLLDPELASSALPMDVEHPPLHPNCRCTILPVISVEDVLNA